MTEGSMLSHPLWGRGIQGMVHSNDWNEKYLAWIPMGTLTLGCGYIELMSPK